MIAWLKNLFTVRLSADEIVQLTLLQSELI